MKGFPPHIEVTSPEAGVYKAQVRLRGRDPAPTYADYLAKKEQYVAGLASLEDVTALVTPDVARQVGLAELAEARERREEAEEAAQARPATGKEEGQMVLGALALLMLAWIMVLATGGMSTGHPASHPAPAMVTRYTGPGELILDDPHGKVLIPVQTVIEETNGIATRLPVWYVDAAGRKRAWDGAFQFTPATVP